MWPFRWLGGGAGADIPWRHRLSTKLVGAVGLCAVVTAALLSLTEARIAAALVGQMGSGAQLFSQTIERATDRAMLEDRREDAYDTMRAIARQPGIEKVRLFNKEGRVTFSTEPGETGRLVDKRAEACFACHAADQPLTHLPTANRSRIFGRPDHRVLGFITALHAEPRCSTADCHPGARPGQVLGVLDVAMSMEEVDGRVRAFRDWSVAVAAAALLLLGGLFVALARRDVGLPVAALVEGTRRVAAEERDVQLHVRTRGELGLLAAAFNDMARSLQRAEDQLRGLNAGLEEKVAERTADLQRAQQALVQAEKLSSLGRLSASIAHEINNPLAGILTFAKLLLRSAEKDVADPVRRAQVVRNLGLVEREAERCSAIVRNLLDFARERPLEARPVSLAAIAAEALELVGHQLQMAGHALERRLAPVPQVQGDYGQLRQAIVNVVLNASQAMPGAGRIAVETRAVDGDRQVEVIVSDTGPGIPPEVLGKIFDPFFTTKEKGTGLGLSVVYGILQRHGGTVEARSAPGQGTTFVLRLPAAPAAAEPR